MIPTITLLTDFGLTDTYVAEMKGIIAGIAPDARVVDLTHHVPPQDITAGAVLLDDAVDAFADSAIHVAVVDPSVGGERHAVAVQTANFTLVGPDNGLFTLVLQRYAPQCIVRLTNTSYHRSVIVSSTFHGRDIFSPAAAHLAAGVTIEQLGEPLESLIQLDLSQPFEDAQGIHGVLLRIDHFGNLITNLRLPADDQRVVYFKEQSLGPIRRTFSDVEVGKPVGYVGSHGRIEIGIRNGDAAQVLKAEPGDCVLLML